MYRLDEPSQICIWRFLAILSKLITTRESEIILEILHLGFILQVHSQPRWSIYPRLWSQRINLGIHVCRNVTINVLFASLFPIDKLN